MHAILYAPGLAPTAVDSTGLSLPNPITGFAPSAARVAELLDCVPALVDVLDTGPQYVVYTVFDSEQPLNPAAMKAVAELTGLAFEADVDDEVLRGPVLVVQG